MLAREAYYASDLADWKSSLTTAETLWLNARPSSVQSDLFAAAQELHKLMGTSREQQADERLALTSK